MQKFCNFHFARIWDSSLTQSIKWNSWVSNQIEKEPVEYMYN